MVNLPVVVPVHSYAEEGQDVWGRPPVNANVDVARDTLLKYD